MECIYWASHDSDKKYYDQFIASLNIPIIFSEEKPNKTLLFRDQKILKILLKDNNLKQAFYVEFGDDKKMQQLKSSLQSGQILTKAIGKEAKSILDMTGGWASDSFMFSVLGLNVTAVESNSGVFALTNDALMRFIEVKKENEALINTMGEFKYIYADSCEWLKKQPQYEFDVIYIDPMFPDKKKSLSSKSMQVLQSLVGKNQVVEPLLEEALIKAGQRVIIKRPLKSNVIGTCTHSYKGKSIRYDMYKVHKKD